MSTNRLPSSVQGCREQVREYCAKLAASNLASGTSGNISVFDPESRLCAISPSAMDYQRMTAADVVVLDSDGAIVAGERRPSSEAGLHLACYRARADLRAVVHTHSVAATSVAVLGRELPAVHYMLALCGRARLPCAPYALFGSEELAAHAVAALAGGYGCLLQNHGVLATGADIHHAWSLAEQIEFCADLYLRASAAGTPHVLSDTQMQAVIDQLDSYRPQG